VELIASLVSYPAITPITKTFKVEVKCTVTAITFGPMTTSKIV